MGPDYKDSNIFSVPKDPKRLSRHCSSNASGKSSLPAASTLSVSTSRPPTGASLSHAPTRSTVNAVSHAAVYASSSGSIEEEVERKTIASSDGQSAQARKEGGSSVNTDSDNPSSTGSTESHVDGTGGNIGGGEGAKTNDDQGDTDLAFGSIDAVAGESESTEEGRGFCARWFCSLMTAGDMSSSSAQAQQLGHVRIIPYTLQFEKAMHEHTYMQFIRKSHGSLSRWAMLFGISFGALEPFFAYDSLEHKNATNVLVLLTMRYAFVLLCLLLLPVTFTQHFARHAAKYNAGIYGFAFISTALVPVLLSDPGLHYDSHITALTYVVYMTILCNSGTVRFGACSIMVVLAVVLYAVCALMSVMETGDVLYFSFLIICVAIINLTSSYGRELSARQEFVLTFRVRREKDKAERLLYAMLPKPVANALRSQDHIGGGEELKMNLHSRLSLQYNQVTILYSDIRGFTQYSAQNTPEDVVNLLSKLFSSFDRLTVVHQVYKVRVYVCVCE